MSVLQEVISDEAPQPPLPDGEATEDLEIGELFKDAMVVVGNMDITEVIDPEATMELALEAGDKVLDSEAR